ncbi:MAG: hypothetical protein ACR2H1_04510 [Limisphaerales bacterium]
MKKFLIILVCCVIVGVIYFVIRSPKVSSSTAQSDKTKTEPASQPSTISSLRERLAKSKSHTDSATNSPLVAGQTASPQPRKEVVTHTAVDFGKGESSNLIVTDNGLQIGNDTRPTTFPTPYKIYGVYHSPEIVTEPFSTIIPSYQATIPTESAMTFSIRTRSSAGTWSTWQDVSAPDQPLTLETSAIGWQYRLMFHANDSANSPRIQNVTLTTQNLPLAANNTAPQP